MRWRLHPLADLDWRQLGNEWVVFDSGSGLTHAMDVLHAAVLNCFEERAHDGESLLAALRSEYGVESADRGSVQQVIDELSAQGLIDTLSA